MKMNSDWKKIKTALRHKPYIIVGMCSCESDEICRVLDKHNIPYDKADLSYKQPVWQKLPEEQQVKIREAFAGGRPVIGFCINGSAPEEAISVPIVWYGLDAEQNEAGPLVQLDMALDGEVSPYHELVAANSWGFIFEMRKTAVRLMKGEGAQECYDRIMTESRIKQENFENYVRRDYDPEEYGIGDIPAKYRAGMNMVMKTIRRRDRRAQGVSVDQEKNAEKAVLGAYLVGSVTVVESENTAPSALLDRLIESERFGVLMLLSGNLSYFYGPNTKVNKLKEHFPDGRVGAGIGNRGFWYSHYSKPLVLEYVKNMEKKK